MESPITSLKYVYVRSKMYLRYKIVQYTHNSKKPFKCFLRQRKIRTL